MAESSYGTKKESCEPRVRDDCRMIVTHQVKKRLFSTFAIGYLPFANLPMEELIKVHARHLADIENFIWDRRDGEFACHLGIASVCQLEALVGRHVAPQDSHIGLFNGV